MPDANSYSDDTQHKRYKWIPIGNFFVSVGTLIVLAVTLAAVVKYTCEAHRQNALLRESIDTNTRPYLSVRLHPEEFDYNVQSAVARGRVVSMPYEIANYGKLPADAIIDGGIEFKAQETPDASPADGQERRFIFPPPAATEEGGQFTAIGITPMTVGEIAELDAGTGVVMVVIAISYNGHTLRTCDVFPIERNPRISLDKGRRCTGPNSNYAN